MDVWGYYLRLEMTKQMTHHACYYCLSLISFLRITGQAKPSADILFYSRVIEIAVQAQAHKAAQIE